MTTQLIDLSSPYLDTVKALGKANTGTLGFLPEGAFDDAASRGHIIVALRTDGSCCGYVLFRVSRRRIYLVHLCVDESVRRAGMGRTLIEHVKKLTTEHYLGISLKCRRDYSANAFWPRLGFIARGEVTGRGKDRMPLTKWAMDYGHRTLFTEATIEHVSSKLCVVLDANVFFDLDDESRAGYVESCSLLADWLPETLELCVTDEINNEINRGPDAVRRHESWALAQRFTVAPCDETEFTAAQRLLRQHFPSNLSERDESDLRQLARTVASDIQFFVTRDEPLLSRAEEFYKTAGLSVIRPSDLILRFDEIRRESEYQPGRLAGSLSKTRRFQSVEDREVIETFLLQSAGESRETFRNKLRGIVSDPQTYECRFAESSDGLPIALFAFGRRSPDTLEIPLLRVRRGPLAKTIARYLVFYGNWTAARERRSFTRIIEQSFYGEIESTIATDNFLDSGAGWVKVNIPIASDGVQIGEYLRRLNYLNEVERTRFFDIADVLERGTQISDAQMMADLECLLWPAKILDAAIPNFIVPIQPEWAKDLFDEGLANQTLFGADVELALNRESAYYRAKNPSGLKAPARILWYISGKSKRYSGVGRLRACSRLDEVVVGKPKELFRQFRRLGVYRWENVFDLAGKNLDHELMAFRFTDTELFDFSIERNKLQEILSKYGQRALLMSPVRIPPEAFGELYELGMRRGAENE